MAADCMTPGRAHPRRRNPCDRAARLSVLALVMLAGGCTSDRMGTDVSRLWSPFMGPTMVDTSQSLTVQRVRGQRPVVEALVPETGNVWPDREAERATIGGPNEAMRDIPAYRPSLIEGAPAAASPVPTPGDRPVPRARRGSSSPVGPLGPPGEFARSPASAAPAGASSPPSAGLEGRAMTTPSGQAVTSTGGTSRVQGYTGAQGGGAVIRDGNVETWVGPDGQTHTRVVPN